MPRVVQRTSSVEPGAVAGGGGEASGGRHTAANAEQADTTAREGWLGILAGLRQRSYLTSDQRGSPWNTCRAQATEHSLGLVFRNSQSERVTRFDNHRHDLREAILRSRAIPASSAYSILHNTPSPGLSLPFSHAALVAMLTWSFTTRGSSMNFFLAVLRTAITNMMKRREARTHPCHRPWHILNDVDALSSSSRTHTRIPSGNWRKTEIALGGTSNLSRMTQRKTRSTESYAFWRSTRHMYSGTISLRPNSCSLCMTNIMPVVDLPGRSAHCAPGKSCSFSMYDISRPATIFRRSFPT